MHVANMEYWKHVKEKYPRYFVRPSKVLEVGSYNINGTVRVLFDVDHYIGLDWIEGKGVDYVSLAHEANFDYQFDTVISSSMLEHDPYWNLSIAKMVSLLKDDGILLLSWGGARNYPHCLGSAPDGQHHPLAADKVLHFLQQVGFFIDEFRYEDHFMGAKGFGQYVVLIAFKDKKYSTDPHIVEARCAEDMSLD